MYDLICALKYMHSAKVLHRDLKPGNILVDVSPVDQSISNVRITDYGLARTINTLHPDYEKIYQSTDETLRKVHEEEKFFFPDLVHDGKDHEVLGAE